MFKCKTRSHLPTIHVLRSHIFCDTIALQNLFFSSFYFESFSPSVWLMGSTFFGLVYWKFFLLMLDARRTDFHVHHSRFFFLVFSFQYTESILGVSVSQTCLLQGWSVYRKYFAKLYCKSQHCISSLHKF